MLVHGRVEMEGNTIWKSRENMLLLNFNVRSLAFALET
jgi:hypothetical protein